MKTKEEILEGNKLIAAFMGYDFDTTNSQTIGYPTENGFRYRLANFHSSWEWLMPVTTKIYIMYQTLPKSHDGIRLEQNLTYYLTTRDEVFNKERLNGLFISVIEFIKWYNEQKK